MLAPKHDRIFFRLVSTLLEPEEEVLRLANIEVTGKLIHTGIT